MRLTAELIKNAQQYVNPIKEREINLRGFKIPAIENLGVTNDEFQTIDLSDNEITKFANLPLLNRCICILLNNNRVTKVAPGLGEFLPFLASLILTNNKIAKLKDLDPLSSLQSLERLSLVGNPCTKLRNYRLYVIFKIPQLKHLDYMKIKPKEREESRKLYGDPDNAPLAEDMKDEEEEEDKKAAKAFTPGEAGPSDQDRAKILEAIKNAKTLEEIERLEKMLQPSGGDAAEANGNED